MLTPGVLTVGGDKDSIDVLDDESYADSQLIITCHSIAAVLVLVVSVGLQLCVRPYAYSI
jgi:hypothetical protein